MDHRPSVYNQYIMPELYCTVGDVDHKMVLTFTILAFIHPLNNKLSYVDTNTTSTKIT